MWLGILAGLTTGALWGLTFVAPRAVEPFSSWDITVARYSIFGFVCVLAMLHPRMRPARLPRRLVVTGVALGGIGYVGYFISAAYAVRMAGAAVPPLIIGTMPLVLAVIANLRDRSVSWHALRPPLMLIGLGIALVNGAVLTAADDNHRTTLLFGVAAACVSLTIWVCYALVNAAVMASPQAPDGLHWTGLQGLGAGAGSLLLLPLTSFLSTSGSSAPFETTRFAIWALIMGIAGSWIATWCWVVASKRLPLALSSQLIVSETVFGLAFGFIFERRWPTAIEATGCGLQLTGVVLAIAVFTSPKLVPDATIEQAT